MQNIFWTKGVLYEDLQSIANESKISNIQHSVPHRGRAIPHKQSLSCPQVMRACIDVKKMYKEKGHLILF